MQADCRFEPGMMMPLIDPTRCEAKGPCVPICPYDVLEIRAVTSEEKAALPFVARLKLLVHGGRQTCACARCLPGLRAVRAGLPGEGDHAAKESATMIPGKLTRECGVAIAVSPDESGMANFTEDLSRARMRIVRLEKTVAELLLKNEQLRQALQRV